MTQQQPTPNESTDRWGFLFKPHLVSLLFHLGLIGVIVWVTTLNRGDQPQIIEMEIVEIPPPLAEKPPVPPRPEPAEKPPVPKLEQIKTVNTTARPYHPDATIINQLPRQPTTQANQRPTLPPTFAVAMEATVQGGTGIEVVVVAADANVLADPNKPGWPSPLNGDGFPNAEYADTWEITAEPEPINDRDFKPVYPPNARARRVEAAGRN
jgi:hypothetical protein